MSKSILTLSEEQEAAVDISKNIAVSAGAGSGKTRVLTNRFLRLLDSGIDIDEIVAITFTEKAALEMKERIRSAINERLASSSKEDKVKWQHAMDKLSRANISTIDSFCAKIIRENAASIGIDFDFKIINEIDKKLVLLNGIEKSMKELTETLEYEELLKKLEDTYGDEYIKNNFTTELFNIFERLRQSNKKVAETYDELKNNDTAELVIKILLKTETIYTNYKLDQDELDYTDLECLCNEVLMDSRIRARYKHRYKRFLVDEFQDTNEIQKSIIYNFVTDDNGNLLPKRLFIVGDSKQSIYGFRGTDYTIYNKVAEDVGAEGQKSLSTCYRSKKEIIYGINKIFNHLIKGYEELKVPKDIDDNCIDEKRLVLLTYKNEKSEEIKPIIKVKEAIKAKNISLEDFKKLLYELKTASSTFKEENSLKQEAISKAVRYLMDRGLKAKDICILVRSKYIIPDIEEELVKYNILHCVIGGRGFYEKEEIKYLIKLYALVINDFQFESPVITEIKFLEVLRSFIFNVPDDILYKIKLEQLEIKDISFFKAMELVADGLKESEYSKLLRNTYSTLEKLIKLKSKLSTVQLLKAIINICEIKNLVLMQGEGLQKYRNIEKLILEAEGFDRENLFSPKEFISYLKLLENNNVEDEEASLDSEYSEAVKIMTIHQSKGLEFEGVIIPELDSDQLKISKKERDKKNIIYSEGKIISRLNIDATDHKETSEYNEYFDGLLLKETEESIRVLYVALTRAKQYAVMVGEELKEKEEITEVFDKKEKIANLNSFIKQILYPFRIKGEDVSIIKFAELSELENMMKLEAKEKNKVAIDLDSIKENLEFSVSDKIRSYVSASRYMKCKEDPEKFSVQQLLNININKYLPKIEANQDNYDDVLDELSLNALEGNQIFQNGMNYLKGAELGSIVHKILEYKNNGYSYDDETLIRNTMVQFLGEDKFSALGDKVSAISNIKRLLSNYNYIEKNRKLYGELVLSRNELSFLSCISEDNRTILTGFIDRLEVFRSEQKLIGVITDYKTNHYTSVEDLQHLVEKYTLQLRLYGQAIKDNYYFDGSKLDEIVLQLYFLEKGKCVEVHAP